MTILTTQPILTHLKDRLRANYVEADLYPDADLLVLLNDAYRDACEQSRCLTELQTITLTAGTSEYPLPAACEVFSVFTSGVELTMVSLAEALSTATPASYYVYQETIGFSDLPDGAASAIVHLSVTPPPLASYDSAFDARFPVEYSDILVHYVRWRVQAMSGGAERSGQAQIDRQIYDRRVADLRRSCDMLDDTGRVRFVTDTERIGSASRAS